MKEKVSEIIISIRKEQDNHHKVFGFDITVDQEVIASNQFLTPTDTKFVQGFSLRFNSIFESTHISKIVPENLTALGTDLFKVWFDQFWDDICERIPKGNTRFLAINSIDPVALNLPWELLHPPGVDFLGFDPKFSIRRFPTEMKKIPHFEGQLSSRPLRILFVASSPRDIAELDFEREEKHLLLAVSNSGAGVAFHSGNQGTFEELKWLINEYNPHIVHLTGHGIVKDDGIGYFVFEDDRGLSDLRSSNEIKQELFAGSDVQCVFISGCQTGKAPPHDALGGICQGLVGDEVPFAIGWAASIVDDIATDFASTFYKIISSGQSIDRALVLARQTIREVCEERGVPSWTLPVLYSSTNQVTVFNPDPSKPPAPIIHPVVRQNPLPGMTEGYSSNFVGRRREIQRILPKLIEGSVRIALITGLGGIGKSTLATKIARILEAEGFMIIPIPSSESNQLNSARILQACGDALLVCGLREDYEVLREKELPVGDRLRYLIALLNNNPFLLVIDNFEVNLDEENRRITDNELSNFYTSLFSDLTGASRVILTSRYKPSTIEHLPSSAYEITLGDFSEAVFLKFLMRDPIVEARFFQGELPYDLIVRLYDLVGGVPRFMEHVCHVMRQIPIDDLKQEINAILLPTDSDARQLLSARTHYCEEIFTRRLFNQFNDDQKKAISKLSVLKVPVFKLGLAEITGVPKEKLDGYLELWRVYSFIYPTLSTYEEELWTVYGLLRGWILSQEQLSEHELIETNKKVGEYLFRSAREYYSIDPRLTWVDYMIEAKNHFIQSLDYENAREVVNNLSSLFMTSGMYDEILFLNDELHEFDPHIEQMAWIGKALYQKGNSTSAREWFDRCLNNSNGLTTPASAEAVLGNATIDMEEGKFELAEEGFTKVLEVSEHLGVPGFETSALHQLASLHMNKGELDKARDEFLRVLEIEREIGASYGEGNTLQQIGMVDLFRGEHDSAREYFNKSLDVKRKIGDRLGIANTLQTMASIDIREEKIDDAIKRFHQALEIVQNIGHRYGEAVIWHSLAMIDLDQGNLLSAREKFLKTNQFATEINNKEALASSLQGLGEVDKRENDYRAAIGNFRKALDLRRQIGNRRGECVSLTSIAHLEGQNENFMNARSLFEEALMISREIGDLEGEANNLQGIGLSHFWLHELEDAKIHFNNALEIWKKISDKSNQAIALNMLSRIDTIEGKSKDAHDKLLEILTITREIGDRRKEASALIVLGIFYKIEENLQSAHKYFEEAKDVFIELSMENELATVLTFLGAVNLDLKEYSLARKYYQDSLAIFQATNDLRGASSCWHGIGNVHLAESELAAAKKCFKKSLRLCKRNNDFMGQEINWLQLAHIDKLQGKDESARIKLKKAEEAHEKILSDTMTQPPLHSNQKKGISLSAFDMFN